MSYDENLYSDIPPTKLRNRKEKFRKAQQHPFWCWVADRFFYNMLEDRFYGLRIKDRENFDKRDKRFANIFYAPHSNWWDGIVGYNICKRVLHTSIRMMIEEMNRFPLFAKAGAFPINKKSPQEAIKSLKYAVEILNKPEISLWLFPQGIIKPPNFRPIEFQTGITYMAQNIAKRYGGVNLIPVAVNYSFLREHKPEVLAQIGEPITVLADDVKNIDRKKFTNKLQCEFEQMCDEQFNDIRNGKIMGYHFLFRSRLPWYRKLERRLKNIAMNRPTK